VGLQVRAEVEGRPEEPVAPEQEQVQVQELVLAQVQVQVVE
jgi:hypothetical protein